MPLPDLTEEEHAELIRLIREAIDGDRYFMSARVRRLKSILAKVDPASVERVGTPYRHRSRRVSQAFFIAS